MSVVDEIPCKSLLIKLLLPLTVMGLVLLYALCAAAFYLPGDYPYINNAVANHMLSDDEFSFLELASAVFWFLALILFIRTTYISLRKTGLSLQLAWFMLYVVVTLFAFGEEISWGYHYVDFNVPQAFQEINAQNESNLHNINLTKYIDLEEGSRMHYYLSNISRLLNPAFYLFIFLLWTVMPWLKENTRYLNAVPAVWSGIGYMYFIHAIIFILIDQILFNVGQIFEFYISIFALMVATDIHHRYV